MNPAIALIVAYVVVAAILQFIAFLICLAVDRIDPALGLLTFVILFLAMFGVAWPIAVRLSGAWFPDTSSDASKPGASA